MSTSAKKPLFTHSQRALLATGFGVALVTPLTYQGIRRQLQESAKLPVEQDDDVSSVWSKEAARFDNEVAWTESVWGINYLRRRLLKRARGKILEVGVGTGRNLEAQAYLWKWQWKKRFSREPGPHVEDLTCSDLVSEMLHEAETKAAATKDEYIERALKEGRIHFIQADASALPFPQNIPEDQKFDTIVQTMGLCSETHPEKALKEMQRVCKRDGQILLLEHGRSTWTWLNQLLDGLAKIHAVRYGCWWNRDIGSIVRRSGLIIEKEERWHFGTTSFIVARPGPP